MRNDSETILFSILLLKSKKEFPLHLYCMRFLHPFFLVNSVDVRNCCSNITQTRNHTYTGNILIHYSPHFSLHSHCCTLSSHLIALQVFKQRIYSQIHTYKCTQSHVHVDWRVHTNAFHCCRLRFWGRFLPLFDVDEKIDKFFNFKFGLFFAFTVSLYTNANLCFVCCAWVSPKYCKNLIWFRRFSSVCVWAWRTGRKTTYESS